MSEAYLRDEFERVENCDELDEFCSVSMPNEYDPFKWKAVFIGPKTSPYAGGFFRLDINFPNNYPNEKPEVYFRTKLYHPNINFGNGRVCISSLNKWNKNRSIIEVLFSIYVLLLKPNPEDPYNKEAAELYKTDKEQFKKKANEYVRKYALINK